MLDAQDDLSLNVQVVVDQQVIGGHDRAGQRILDRQQAIDSAAVLQGGDDVGKGAAGEGCYFRAEMLAGGLLGVGAVLALEGNDGRCVVHQ